MALKIKWACLVSVLFFGATALPAHAQWEYGGKLLAGESWPVVDLSMCPDGAGGVFVAWTDGRQPDNPDIYVQRVDSAGYELWPHDGVQAVIDTAGQSNPMLVPDGAGGAIVAWHDIGRSEPILDRVYAQHLSPRGELLWPDTGLAIINWGSNRTLENAISDCHNGLIVQWCSPMAVQRIDSLGNLLWGPEGLRMTDSIYDQVFSRLVMTSDSCFVSVWFDERGLYAQKFNLEGQRLWNPNGVSVTLASLDEDTYEISPTPDGGIYVFWRGAGVVMQLIDGSGTPRWGLYGNQIQAGNCGVGGLCSDFDGRAIISWIYDNNPPPFTGHFNIIDTSGALEWPDGITLNNNTIIGYGITQSIPGQFELGFEMGELPCRHRIIKYDMVAGFVWGDTGVCFTPRAVYGSNVRMLPDGLGGVFIAWKDAEYWQVYLNRVYPNGWVAPDTTNGINEDSPILPSSTICISNYPNPFNSQTVISINLPSLDYTEVSIYDILGRKIKSLYQGIPKLRYFKMVLDGTILTSSGIYFIQTRQNSAQSTKAVTMIK
jgi:hypothetical protein